MKRTTYQIYDIVEFVLGLFAISIFLIAIILYYKNSNSPVALLFIITLSIISLILLIKLFKLKMIADLRLKEFPEAFHAFTHKLRNEFYLLQHTHDHKNEIFNHEYLIENLRSVGRNSSDILAKILTDSTGYNISVSIKYFPIMQNIANKNNFEITNDLESVYIKTLCSSSNSNHTRIDDCFFKLSENTSFYKIMVEHASHFAATNLIELNDQSKKCNGRPYQSTISNWQNFYKSEIVVPIRIEGKYLSNRRADIYDLLGFICVDSQSTSAFRVNEIYYYVELIKAFSDVLYKYFDRVLFYISEMPKEQEKTHEL